MSEDRLSGLDSSFLHMEREGAHMHVASTVIMEGPAPRHEEIQDHIAARLHLVPRFRQKLRFVPLGQGRPVWVDDPHLNLSYHIRQTALPPPGSEEQLRNLAARIFSQQLDRSKPLWEMWLAEGLEGGRFALITKSHHALVDGVSGVDITHVLFDTAREPETPPAPGPEWLPRPEPTGAKLLADALLERATSPAEIVRGARAAIRGPRQVASQILGAAGAAGEMIGAGLSAPPSPFNVEIGPHRRFAFVRADITEFKRIKNEHGGTVNDVVLSTVTGALGNYLRARGHDTTELEMKAMVPVSVRAEHEHGALGNRVAAMMAPLPVWCEDPVERLHLTSASMGDLKSSGQAVGAQVLAQMSDFAPPTIAAQAARLTPRQRFFNLVVTNVPGPQIPLYMLGREMEAIFPMVPLAQRQALCVGIMSYNGQINFGLTGDYDAMADLDAFALDLEGAIEEISAATPEGEGPKGQGQAEVREALRSGHRLIRVRPRQAGREASASAAILLRSMRQARRQLRVGDQEVELRVRRSARARRARIRIVPGRPAEVVVPERMSEGAVDRVIRDHREWIGEKASWARAEVERASELGLDRPGVVWLAGSPIRVELRGAGRPVAELSGGRLAVGGPAEAAGAAIGRWYRREARRRLSRVTAREAAALGVRPAAISIRDPRTRWGSCSVAGAISYSWRLIICPPQVLDYVVVHELCHLRFHDHSEAFWRLLSEVRPGWREQAEWLRRHAIEIGGYSPRPC